MWTVRKHLKTSLGTLTRASWTGVDWAEIGKGDPEAWLYFYEHFLESLRQCAAQADRLLLHAARGGDREVDPRLKAIGTVSMYDMGASTATGLTTPNRSSSARR